MITKRRIKQNLLRLVCLYNSRQRDLELAIKAQDDESARVIRVEIARIAQMVGILNSWLREIAT